MMVDAATHVDENVTELRRSLAGAVLGPGDSGYESARRSFNALIDRRPAVIARCLHAGDVATAFDFARVRGLEVAVRGGGHNPAGHCVCDGGLVIDLSLVRKVDVDGAARIARAEGGATWLDFDPATQAFGLVTPGGVVGSTGVAGLTFGGGIGHLTAQHGLTCDNLTGAEVVTPDGTVVRASADENSELLWGLRGGGDNFGVATRLEFRLHPLERVIGGRLTYAGSAVSEALRVFRDVAASAQRDFSCEAVLALDESLLPTLVVAPCYTGSNGDPAGLRALRSVPGLLDDRVQVHSFLAQQHVFNPGYGVDRNYWKGHFVRELPDELLEELLRRMVSVRSAAGPDPDRIPARHAKGHRAEQRGRRLPPCGLQRQRHGELARPSPRRAPDRVGARDRGGDRAVVGERRLHQLHAGRRADRARARGLRRSGVQTPPSAEGAVRPIQHPASQPEHPTAFKTMR